MQIIKQSVKLLNMTECPLQEIELAGRTCYKSEDNITTDSSEAFVRKLIKRDHEAMIEHAYASYRFITDRGVTHEIVRHRLFSYAQESTRYCNYGDGVTFIEPVWFEKGWDAPDRASEQSNEDRWKNHMLSCENSYVMLLDKGWTPQQARSVLPNSLKTEIVVTGNFREWRHFFKLRTAKAAHPQMRDLAIQCLDSFRYECPVVVEDIEEPEDSKGR